VFNSRFNRRLTGFTPMDITGPAAGDMMMRTSADPTGRRVLGTLNNCAGGNTPWGTVLTAEENFNQYFANVNAMPDGQLKTAHQRYGVPGGASGRRWEAFHDRFDCAKEPNEPNRFGWIVEIDPYDPNFVPKKRTALGRTKHEAGTCAIAPGGQVAVYSGDDERFDYLYKFVTANRYSATDRAANLNLLDEGTLHVARFDANGTGVWMPLVFGQGPLTAANGWRNQADVLIRCRQAGDALGATRMDRPEDVEVNPVTGKVYMALTNNTNRTAAQVDRANPRASNRNGHVIEIVESGNDHAATTFRWEIFMLCGLPTSEDTYFAGFDKSQVSAISCPDNVVFDSRGNLWIGTDGMEGTLRFNDTVYSCPTEGPNRGRLRAFLSVPSGAEVCGPEMTPDSTTLFVAIQHPGEGGTFGGTVVSNWPFGSQPPRPGVIAVTKKRGMGPTHIGS
jgi:secreted PhoX family phosphatase